MKNLHLVDVPVSGERVERRQPVLLRGERMRRHESSGAASTATPDVAARS